MTRDPEGLYGVLGLTPQATQAQVRRAYRSLLRQNHPDTRPPDEAVADATLQRASAAYAVLGDPDRRAGYDESAARQGTTRRSLITPVAVRRVQGFVPGGSQPSPIRAGPVRWHRGR